MRYKLLVILLFFPASVYGYSVNEVITFASPDSSFIVLSDLIENANKSIYVNGYTFESKHIAELLKTAKSRGVDVTVILEKSPVGGISPLQKAAIAELIYAGIPVYLSNDPYIHFNHAKYIIVDNTSILVTSENFVDEGFPPNLVGNRGWGAVIVDSSLAGFFIRLFFEDLQKGIIAQDIIPLNSAFHEQSKPSEQRYSSKFKPKSYVGNFEVLPVVAPIDAVEKILALIASANESVYVEQMYIYRYWGSKREGYTPNKFLEACIEAARRGCEVKILMDSTWYNIQKKDPRSNLYTMEYVNSIAKKEGLELEAKLINFKKTGLLKLHNKGVVVDNKIVLVSSINWNEHSPTKNREVGIIIFGTPAEYYSKVFLSDWTADEGEMNIWLLVIIPLLGLIILLWRKKVS
jgi:phosphatidylserine/phosphatidylglycerophosphate/cardiolipin synthase-like enzyme